MIFSFEATNDVNTQLWDESNLRLKNDLIELASGQVDESIVKEYLFVMTKVLRRVGDDKLFLMYDEPANMPPDARVEYVYKPTYYGLAIAMTAMNRYPALCEMDLFYEMIRKMMNAAMGRGFMGHGWENYRGFLDTLEIFALGDVIEFTEKHREVNTQFANLMDTAIQLLETEICTGNAKDPWQGSDYSDRGKQILQMLRKH